MEYILDRNFEFSEIRSITLSFPSHERTMISINLELKTKDHIAVISKNRYVRALRHPLKTLAVVAMRSAGLKLNRQLTMPNGMQFCGVLPEAISSQIWREGFYDPKTTLKLIKLLKKGDTFLDIGAHFGYFTLIGQSLVSSTGQVVSIEPMPGTYRYVTKNIAVNNLSKSCLSVQKGAFDKPRDAEFMDYGIVYSSLNGGFSPRTRYRKAEQGRLVKVELDSVDSILAQFNVNQVDVVKIDAESSEYFVIRGMMETIKVYRPSIIIEVDAADIQDETGIKAILSLLEPFGYGLFDLSGDEFVALNVESIQKFGNLILMDKQKLNH